MEYQFFKKKKYTLCLLLLLSIFFTTSSVFWTVDIVHHRRYLSQVELGWPITFITQNQDNLDPPLPYEMGVVLGVPTEINPLFFMISFLLNMSFFALVFTLPYLVQVRFGGGGKKGWHMS